MDTACSPNFTNTSKEAGYHFSLSVVMPYIDRKLRFPLFNMEQTNKQAKYPARMTQANSPTNVVMMSLISYIGVADRKQRCFASFSFSMQLWQFFITDGMRGSIEEYKLM